MNTVSHQDRSTQDMIANYIAKHGRVTLSDLARKFRTVKQHQRNQVLEALLDAGQIEINADYQDGAGRPAQLVAWLDESSAGAIHEADNELMNYLDEQQKIIGREHMVLLLKKWIASSFIRSAQ
jgi:predicted ArsR family transcriptional regulator